MRHVKHQPEAKSSAARTITPDTSVLERTPHTGRTRRRVGIAGRHGKALAGIVLAGIILACVSLPAMAKIFWEDGFEPGQTGYALVDGMSYTTKVVHSGTRALDESFCSPTAHTCGTYSDRFFPFTTNLYSRWWMYIAPGFVVSPVATKLMFQGDNGTYPSFWWGMPWGNPELGVTDQGVVINGILDSKNYYGASIPIGQWVCIETHLKMSTPGVNDGVIEAWINGKQVMNVTDALGRQASASSFPPNSPTAGFTFNRLYVQLGQGHIYYDDIAVGDQRIGCGTTATLSPPTGLTVK